MAEPCQALALALRPAQVAAIDRFREAMAASPNAVQLSLEDAVVVLFAIAVSPWMDETILDAQEVPCE